MKKKLLISAAAAVYTILVLGLCFQVFDMGDIHIGTHVEDPGEVNNVETPAPPREPERNLVDAERDFSYQEGPHLEYAAYGQPGRYVESEDLVLLEEDRYNILVRFQLPELERMSEEDAALKMADLQVFRKMNLLGADSASFVTPEYNWKKVYSDSLAELEKTWASFGKTAVYEGETASSLNIFLQEHVGYHVEIGTKKLVLDETIQVPSNISIDGQGVEIASETGIEYAIHMNGVENVVIQNIKLLGGFERGIYIVESHHVLLYRNEVANGGYKGIIVMGDNQYINLVGNSVHDNAWGAVVFQGSISNSIIQHNTIYANKGPRNLGAGLVLSAVPITDLYRPYEQDHGFDEYLYNMLDGPHDVVVKDNDILDNYSSGVYLDGAYEVSVIDNRIIDNEKEGMCLDFGTFGSYISGNIIRRNGHRNRQTDVDLEKDFVLGLGRMEDGSSTAKLPGISLDNAAYNIIYDNIVEDNSGTGIKMVRSGFRNLILCNLVTDNNRGQNDMYHGFGVELGYARQPDQEVKGLDFEPDYENIIARNVISGVHYSGIYIGEECYCNDFIDNVILDCTQFSVESYSEFFNSSVGNNTNVPMLNF